METWFAKIVIACAGIHDILLWVALGFATAIASEGSYTAGIAFKSIGISLSFILGTLFIGYFLFKRMTFIKQNLLFRSSNLGYLLFIMFMLASLA